ncbi:DUF91 domain-containing protein [Staphylococcus pragensis]|uniref:DUF91 domain-containing protein n=1 Tax=Staphylococcus pragensis TaxID=1611836 RepID=A0A4Z1BT09_9STAP|nr:DUF5655 domain-containing protein [Staphylococcus pragensis]RTX92028.1 DUF91 domain-containing protein [Staphylococcus carnosus]TGN26892.1 DUF91 domain-containing protein [Staphylococcus pragensis]GGG93688.1 hypothetical protein GCM10007342_15860 [Staphylococcus pragensis]
MGDIKLFRIEDGNTHELEGESLAIEKSLQNIIEENSEELLGIKFLETEYTTGKNHGGRIDTLAIDENYCPVIIEYKRTTNENVINQGLFYLDWLLDHKAEFELIVMKKLGKDFSDKIDWSSPRLLCIAGGFTRYDEHAVKQINRNIELYRYKYFENTYLMLDLVNTTFEVKNIIDVNKEKETYLNKQLKFSSEHLTNLYKELKEYLMNLGDDVQFKELKLYLAFKRIKNFVCMEILPNKQKLLLYVKVDVKNVAFEKGFIRDVTNIGHYGTGNLAIEIRNKEDIEKAKKYIEESYENN